MIAALLSNIAALVVDKHSLYEQLKKDYLDEVIKDDQAPEQETVASEMPKSIPI
jgi:hypothetical protein